MKENNFGSEKPAGSEKPDVEGLIGDIINQLDRLNVHQLRRLAMSLDLVSSDEIVLEEEKGFKKKVTDYINHLKELNPKDLPSRIMSIRTRIGNIEHL